MKKTFFALAVMRVMRRTCLFVGILSLGMGVAPLFAQLYPSSGNLADLKASGGTLAVDDKIFSGFDYQVEGLTSFDASQITVTASESGGIDYLTWSGNISLVGGGPVTADLLLNYVVTANAGAIDYIDQAYTGSAQNGFLAVDETAAIGAFGGVVAGSSHLTGVIPSNPPTYANDDLNIIPPQTVLYVTKDIALGIPNDTTTLITISRVTQSFHQVPEPDTLLLGLSGGGWLLLLRLRRPIRRA